MRQGCGWRGGWTCGRITPRVSDADDPLHAMRAAEVTSLWRLAVKA